MSASSPSEKQLSIPKDVYRAMRVPDVFGKARQLASMTKWEFHELLKEKNIERHYTEENLEEDLEYARE